MVLIIRTNGASYHTAGNDPMFIPNYIKVDRPVSMSTKRFLYCTIQAHIATLGYFSS